MSIKALAMSESEKTSRRERNTQSTKEKRPVGRPPELVLYIDDKAENIAKSFFGIKSNTPKKPKTVQSKD